jgi:toxin ParE1/3/4
MRRFRLSPRAQADIDEIWEYTESRWGIDQAEAYLRQIEAAIRFITADPQRGRSCDELRTGYRKHAVGEHIIFYRTLSDDIDIVRILHRRMDFERHL